MLAVYTLLEAGDAGFGSLQTIGLGAISIALITAFVVRQARIENPLMPLRLFKSRNVTGANLVMGLLVVGFFGMFFLGALYMGDILGYNPLQVGLAFLPSCLVMGTLSLGYAEKIIMGIGPRTALLAGLGFIVGGLLLFARAPVDANYIVDVFPVMVLLGLGAGVSFPALMTLAMSGATPQDSGLASGLVNTTTQVAGAIGLAVLATVSHRAHRDPARRRRRPGLGRHQRLPPRVPDRRRADRGRGRRRPGGRPRPGRRGRRRRSRRRREPRRRRGSRLR